MIGEVREDEPTLRKDLRVEAVNSPEARTTTLAILQRVEGREFFIDAPVAVVQGALCDSSARKYASRLWDIK